ncbi:MAG TPA: lysophospholipid acyltransferase family protein [Nitrospirota bacterium]
MNRTLLQARKRLTRLSLIGLTKVIRLFSLIVPYRFGVWVGGAIGLLFYYVLRRERGRALEHLGVAYPDQDIAWKRRIARHCFIHLGKSLLETMLIKPERLRRIVEVRGEEKLRTAMEQGRGAVFVTGHIGNWEMMGHYVSSLFPLSVVAAPIEPQQVNDMIVGLRSRMNVRTILRGRPGASRELIRIFKENRVLGILIDQDTDVESAFVDFMGRPAWTPTGAASMALKFGAPVIYGFIHRDRNNHHTVVIEGPLELVRTGDLERDITLNTAMLTKKIEDSVRSDPEQWVWMHRRWRRQP